MKLRKIISVLSLTIFSFMNIYAQSDTITVESNPLLGGTVSGGGEYLPGTEVTVTASPAEAYLFTNWSENSVIVSSDSDYTFITGGNRSLTANFDKKSYNISLSVNPLNSGIVTGAGSYNHGDTVVLDAQPAEGYTFTNWTEGGLVVSTDSNYSFSAKKNRILIANFTLMQFSIVTNSNPLAGGTTTGAGNYNYGDPVNLEAIPNEGYSFVNWTEEGLEVSKDSLYNFTAVSNRNLLANFQINSYTVTSNVTPLNSGNVIGSGNYDHGTIVNLEAIPSVGYSFNNWMESGAIVSTDSIYSFSIVSDRSLTANFTLNSYIISTVASPIDGGVVSGGGTFDHGEMVNLTASSVDGYKFLNWTINDSIVATDSNYTFICTKNATVVGNFSLRQYSVTATPNPIEGGVTLGEGLYEHGSIVNVSARSNTGWKFDSWTSGTQILSIDSNYSFVIFENKDLKANFIRKNYLITIQSLPAEGGTTSGSGYYPYDSLVTLIATPNYGWNFVNWKENDQILSADSILSFNLTTNRNITANFNKQVYSITAAPSPEIGGTVSGDSNYTYGDLVTLRAVPNSINGWDFVNWTENSVELSKDTVYSFTAQKNSALVANFKLRDYSLDLSVYPANSGTTDGEGTYTHGDSATITATPEAGWLFANWTDGDNNISSQPSITISIEKNTSLVANFANELYNISTMAEPAEAGFISGSGSFYFGQKATLTPIANPGWEFLNWTENENIISTDSILTFDVSRSMNLEANFQLVNYTINCSVNPPDAGFTSGCGLSYYDQNMTLTASANSGWKFINWTENGDIVSTASNYNFTVSGSRNLVANFDKISDINSVDDGKIIPDNFYLSNAYPNPFNPNTKVNFGLPESSSVKILISDINGRLIRNILSSQILPAGSYSTNIDGNDLSSGVYLFIILAQSEESDMQFKKVSKLILLK